MTKMNLGSNLDPEEQIRFEGLGAFLALMRRWKTLTESVRQDLQETWAETTPEDRAVIQEVAEVPWS